MLMHACTHALMIMLKLKLMLKLIRSWLNAMEEWELWRNTWSSNT